MKETIVEVKDVSIKFNMSSEKYDSFKRIYYKDDKAANYLSFLLGIEECLF